MQPINLRRRCFNAVNTALSTQPCARNVCLASDWLQRQRHANGLTQTDIARRLNITAAAVSKWESGSALPKPKHFKKLARILGVDPLELTRIMVPEAAADVGCIGATCQSS